MMMSDVMSCTADDFGLTADEERHLVRLLLCEGKWPRTVTISRTNTIYEVQTKRQAKRLLRLLGIES